MNTKTEVKPHHYPYHLIKNNGVWLKEQNISFSYVYWFINVNMSVD